MRLTSRQLGQNILSMSVCYENLDILKYIILKGQSDLNSRDSFGRTALHYACSVGFVEGIRLLIQNGANYNIANNAGETPLIKACQFAETHAIEMLLQLAQIDVQAKDVVG